MGVFREVLGAGTLFGVKLWDFSIGYFSNTAGAFLVYGLFIAGFNALYEKFEQARKTRNYVEIMQAKSMAGASEAATSESKEV